ncbi:MAG: helix-turn-helix domain-containing protein [Angustibacter sp.]
MAPRFLTLTDVAETLSISPAQTYALVRSGELPAIKVGGRGQWRVETAALEEYIARMYSRTKQYVDDHPFPGADGEGAEGHELAGVDRASVSTDHG